MLLTAGLAWHHARAGRRTDPWFHAYWTERWGASASPLTWSHAMVILAREAMSTTGENGSVRVE